jgi:hypothetical protein
LGSALKKKSIKDRAITITLSLPLKPLNEAEKLKGFFSEKNRSTTVKLRQLQSDRRGEIPLAQATGALVSELLNNISLLKDQSPAASSPVRLHGAREIA